MTAEDPPPPWVPPAGPAPPPAPPRVSLHPGWLVGGAIALVVVGVLAGAAALVVAPLLAFGAMGEGFVEGPFPDESLRIDVGDLAVAPGDCFLRGTDPTAIERVPCDESHDLEVIASAPPAAATGAAPDPYALESYAWSWCELLFADYVGRPYAESALEYELALPDREAWEAGDRAVTCFAAGYAGEPLEGSVAGSGR